MHNTDLRKFHSIDVSTNKLNREESNSTMYYDFK